MNEIEQSILAHIQGVAAPSQISITRETGLLETGLLDSINLVGLIQFLEERFGIRIPDSDIGADLFTSPASLISYVEQRLGTTPNRAVPVGA
jgi:acyl carrier protein